MNQSNSNPYQPPVADLHDLQSDSKILNFTRFTAWGVFGLSVLTLGIYPIYWMYSRALTVNENHSNRISLGLLYGLVITTILSFASEFFGDSDSAVLVSGVLTVVYIVLYLTVLFTLRNRLQDIINTEKTPYISSLSGVLTFFFNSIYLQYKINEAIDAEKTMANVGVE